LQLRQTQAGYLMTIREYDQCRSARLVNGNNNVTVRGQFFELERIHLTKSGDPVKKDQHRILRLNVCDWG
jgi:hypothetical protein